MHTCAFLNFMIKKGKGSVNAADACYTKIKEVRSFETDRYNIQ